MGPFRARQCECGFAHALQQREEGEEKATSWVARHISQRARAKELSLVAEKAP